MSLIKYNGKNIVYYNFKIQIMPGVNELEKGVLDSLRSHPVFKGYFQQEKIVVIEEDEKTSKSSKNEAQRTVEEMLKIIPQIFDKKLLEKIIKTDGRDQVVFTAKSQLHQLSLEAEDEEKEKSKKTLKVEDGFDESSDT